MKNAAYYLLLIFLIGFNVQPAMAQFEGKITFNSYEYSSQGAEEKDDELTLFITPDRILLQGEKKYEIMGRIQTEGILVRLDFEDFVFLTGDQKVLKISKSDISSVMNMFAGGSQASEISQEGKDVNYERTNQSRTIQGYNCTKFIFRDEDNSQSYSEVWMTSDLQVNWGMLAEPWSGSIEEMISSVPTDLIFQEKYFPVRVDIFEDGTITSKVEATEITESSIAKAMVQIPSGVQVLSFQEYLFQGGGQ